MQISKLVRWQTGWVVLLAFVLAAAPVLAQLPTGVILGVVKDASGGTVAGANVTVTNTDTGVARMIPTGDDGVYRFPALPVGNYEVTVMKEGFESFDRKGLTLVVGQEIPVDVTLQVGATGQTVTVTGEAPQINTTNATTGGVVNDEQVADLPINGRNIVDLTLLQAGIVQTNVFSMTNALGATNIVGTTFSANGAPIHSNSYLLDGAIQQGMLSMNNSSITGSTLGMDGVKEYKVVSSVPSAEYGTVIGATSTEVSKGGSNQWHGDAFDYLRNSSMDARNFFDALDTVNFYGFGTDKSSVYPGKRIPPFQRNNYGAAFGGPIKKDKTFFWAVYEGLSQEMGITVTTNTLPGACYDQTPGDSTYHQVTDTSFLSAGCANLASQTATLENPSTPFGQGWAVTKHFVEDTIFPGQTGVGFFPYPNTNINASGTELAGATFNYSFPYKQPSRENYGQIRLDQNFSASDSAFIRYTQDDASQRAAGGYPQVQIPESSSDIFITIAENHIFSPTVLNTLRYSLQRTVGVANESSYPNIADPNVLWAPSASIGEGFQVFASAGPGSGVTSYSASSGGYGTYIQNVYSYSDDLFWTKGRHALKFGAVLNQYRQFQNQVFQQGGSASFSTFTTFAEGIWSGITTTGGTEYPLQTRTYLDSDLGFYAQDDVRASSKLTLNLGLRYEFATVPREANGLDYTIVNLATALGNNATEGASYGRMFNNPSLHDFSPRIGFAYDPLGKGTMAIRGGAGIYYDVGEYGGAELYEACCEAPTAFSIIVTNSSGTTVPFPIAVPLPTAPSVQGGSQYYGGPNILNSAALPSPRNIDYNLKAPKMIQYNLTIDKQLPFGVALSAGYVGSRGYHLPTDVEGNLVQPLGYLANGLPYYCEAAVNPTVDPTCVNSAATIPNTSCVIKGAAVSATGLCPVNPAEYLVRTNPTLGAVVQYTDRDPSWYNALQVNVNKRITHGLQFTEAFTWSKLLDEGQAEQPAESNSLRESDLINPSLDRGPAGFNATVSSHLNVIYHAPNINSDKFYTKPLNGWWWSAILSDETGYPFDPTLGAARDLTHDSEDVGRPDLGSSFNMGTVYEGTPSQWFNPTAFAVPTIGEYGNAPRDGLVAPGLQELDFSMVKDTRVKWLGEAGSVEFRAELFNILNHPNFGLPNGEVWNPSSAEVVTTFNGVNDPQIQPIGTIDPATNKAAVTAAYSKAGQVTGTNTTSRQVQLALKLLW